MSRLRARNADNTKWLDICQSEWYLRNPANTGWIRFVPKQGIKVMHGSELYWLDIDCVADAGTADCEADEYGGTHDGTGENGSGTPIQSDNSGGGSGNGGGSDGGSSGGGTTTNPNGPDSPIYTDPDAGSGNGGTGWEEDAPYPPGYDLPDSDGDGAGDNGDCINRPGLGTCEPKTEPETRPDLTCEAGSPGSFDCPYMCPESVSGSGKGITEFYANMGTVSGNVKFPWISQTGAISVDIYYRGVRIATTSGQRVGADFLTFVFNPVNNDPLLFIRIRSTRSGTVWNFQVRCVGDEDVDGTVVDPRPCRGTFQPKQEGGQGVHEYYHDMGSEAGIADIHYQMWDQPDRMDVYNYKNELIASTNGYVTGEAHLKVPYEPGGTNQIRVRIAARDSGTSWAYMITCPGEAGSEDNPRGCASDSAVHSGGAGVTDTYIELGSEAGQVGVRYQMYDIPDQLDVYQEGILIASTGGPVTGEHWLYFDYDPANGTKIQVRVTGSGKTSWSFLTTCPGDEATDPNVSVDSPYVKEGSADNPGQACWTVSLDRSATEEVTVDYATGGGTANPLTAQGRVLASDAAGNPFVAVVDQEGIGRAAFDGGFPKFYNSVYSPPQPAPTGQDVFDEWWRTSGAEYYSDPTTIPEGSEALRWAITGQGNLASTVNSTNMIAFLSPVAHNNFEFAATLTSGSSDDDTIALVVSYVRNGSDNHYLLALRHRGGSPQYGSGNWSLITVVNNTAVKVIETKNVGGNGNWGGARTRVKVERNCNGIKVWCSPFGSTTIDESSLFEIDLDHEDLAIFGTGATRWGFAAQSQDNSQFLDIFVSGIGLPPAFTYLKNIALWAAKEGNSKALILCDAAVDGTYSLNDAALSFGVSLPGTLESVGFEVTTRYLREMNNEIVQADLAEYGFLIVLSVDPAGVNHATGNSAAVVAQWVKDGGGMFIITDHNVFHPTCNTLAAPFNVEFYGSINRSPVSVATMIETHGEHPIWQGLECAMLPAGGSEGGIRLKDIRSDYNPTSGTLTFAPGETEKEVCVDLIGNDTVDGNRTINLNLSNVSVGAITNNVGTATIIDDDTAICAMNPQRPVYSTGTSADGSPRLHVQPDINCGKSNTTYSMVSDMTFPANGSYVFSIYADDSFELYIDCKKVASGGSGATQSTISVSKGTHSVVLRYTNTTDCTLAFVSMSVKFNNQVVYRATAADWKGQENRAGDITENTPLVPCGTSAEGGSDSATNLHSLGQTAGTVNIEYATVVVGGTAPNEINVYVDDVLVASTGGPVIVEDTSPEYLTFEYDPSTMGSMCRVEVLGGSWWRYTFNCPE